MNTDFPVSAPKRTAPRELQLCGPLYVRRTGLTSDFWPTGVMIGHLHGRPVSPSLSRTAASIAPSVPRKSGSQRNCSRSSAPGSSPRLLEIGFGRRAGDRLRAGPPCRRSWPGGRYPPRRLPSVIVGRRRSGGLCRHGRRAIAGRARRAPSASSTVKMPDQRQRAVAMLAVTEIME